MKKTILLLLVLLSVCSCGSRKTSRTKTEEKTESKIELAVEVDASSKSEVKNDVEQSKSIVTENDISENQIEAEPINPYLPMEKVEVVENGKKTTIWKNARVKESSKVDKSKKEEKEKKVDLSIKNENQKSIVKSKLKAKQESLSIANSKVTDTKRGFNFCWLLMLMIPTGIYTYWKLK